MDITGTWNYSCPLDRKDKRDGGQILLSEYDLESGHLFDMEFRFARRTNFTVPPDIIKVEEADTYLARCDLGIPMRGGKLWGYVSLLPYHCRAICNTCTMYYARVVGG